MIGGSGFVLVGDNLGALTNTLTFKAKGAMGAVSRELAWRREAYRWRWVAGHLPSEINSCADWLSRHLYDTDLPAELRAAWEIEPPDMRTVWKVMCE